MKDASVRCLYLFLSFHFITDLELTLSHSAICWASYETLFNNSCSYHYKVLKEFNEASLAMCAHIKYSECLIQAD